jgi:hypothetical protein
MKRHCARVAAGKRKANERLLSFGDAHSINDNDPLYRKLTWFAP